MDNHICIFASTKFQILNAMHLTVSKKLFADLYIIDEGIYKNCRLLASKIEEEKIFQHVILINAKKILKFSNYQYVNSFLCYIKYQKIVSSFLLPYKYDIMLFCTGSLIERLTRFFFIQKNNSNTRFLMYDEGVGSYLDNMEQIHRLGDKILRRIIFKKDASRVVFDKLLYIPELYIHYNDPKYGKAYGIPSIDFSKELDIYNRVYEYQKYFELKEPLILMDFPYKDCFTETGKRKYEALIKQVAHFEKFELVIKKHPSDKSKNELNVKYYDYSEVPFEIIIANSDINNKILLSVFSTATVTPKIIFNKEPTVIILYKIFQDDFIKPNNFICNFFERAKKLYQGDNFYIPETQEELFFILNHLKEENDECQTQL